MWRHQAKAASEAGKRRASQSSNRGDLDEPRQRAATAGQAAAQGVGSRSHACGHRNRHEDELGHAISAGVRPGREGLCYYICRREKGLQVRVSLPFPLFD